MEDVLDSEEVYMSEEKLHCLINDLYGILQQSTVN
jgi:hypothetical protein